MSIVTVNGISKLSDSRQKRPLDAYRIELIEEAKKFDELYTYITKDFNATSRYYYINDGTIKRNMSKVNDHLMQSSDLFMNRTHQYISKYLRYYCNLAIEYITYQEEESEIVHMNRVSDSIDLYQHQDFNIVTFLYDYGIEVEPVFRVIYYLRSFSDFETSTTLIETLKNKLKTLQNSIIYDKEDKEMENLSPKFYSRMSLKSHMMLYMNKL